jgi:hypothetical protein
MTAVAASSSSSSSSTCSSSAATQGKPLLRTYNMLQALHARPLFPVEEAADYDNLLRPYTCLVHIEDMPPGQPAHVSLQLDYDGGRPMAIDLVGADNGCNETNFTEAFLDSNGIGWQRSDMPSLQLSNGERKQEFIGQTGPISIVLGQYTPAPLVIHKPEGVAVMRGNAGGLYNLCLGTDDLKWVFAHVNPMYQHLVWYPKAPDDMSVINGVPVKCHYPSTAGKPGSKVKLGSIALLPPATYQAACCQVAQPAQQQQPAAAAVAGEPAGSDTAAAAAVHTRSSSSADQQLPAGSESHASRAPAAATSSCSAAADGFAAGPCDFTCRQQQQHAAASMAAAVAAGQVRIVPRPRRPSLLQTWQSCMQLLLCFLLGCWYYLVDAPLGGLPSRAISGLLHRANQPVWWQRRRQVIAPRPCRPGSHQMPSDSSDARLIPPAAPKHRQGFWRLQRASRALRKQHWRQLAGTAAGSWHRNSAVIPARTLLLVSLLLFSCCAGVTAMHARQHLAAGAAAAGSLSGSIHSQQASHQSSAQQAFVLLGYEFGSRRRSCFRSCSASCRL